MSSLPDDPSPIATVFSKIVNPPMNKVVPKKKKEKAKSKSITYPTIKRTPGGFYDEEFKE
jgi:hypothetical protein